MSTVYLFYGKSGCGKGTQADILKDRLEASGKKVIYVQTGKLFRSIADHKDFVGNAVESVMQSGAFMPAFFPIYLWSEQLVNNYTGVEDIILDGVSRQIEEAPILDSALDFLKIENRFVVHIEVSDQWVTEHMGRRGRADDTLENMTARLHWFNTEVVPIIHYFKTNEKYTVLDINGEQTIEQVAKDIEKALGK